MAENSPLRVLMVGIGAKPETFLCRLVKGLIAEDLQVTVCFSGSQHKFPFAESAVSRLWTPGWEEAPLLRLWRLLRLLVTRFSWRRFSWLRGEIQQETKFRQKIIALYRYLPFIRGDWDVIYFPWNSTAIDYIGLYDLGIPVVVSCRGSQINVRPHLPGQEAYTRKLRETQARASAVHCVSEDILREAQNFGLDPAKAWVIHPAVDPAVFTPTNKANSEVWLSLITTGALIWRKGYEYLLHVLAILREGGIDARLRIIGEGYEHERILFTAQDLALGGFVELLGSLAPAQIVEELQQADIFVLASLSEGLSNASLEAMSCGLPVVSTACGGMPEAISAGVEGFLTPVRDPGAMAEALGVLAQDAGLRAQMGAAGRQRVKQEFTLAEQSERFVAMFRSLRGKRESA